MTVMIALVAGVGFIEGNRQILDKIGWQSFYRTKGKMENGKDLIFIPRERSSMIQTRMVRKDVSCLTGGCQSRPGVFQLVQVSNYGDESAKIHIMQQDI